MAIFTTMTRMLRMALFIPRIVKIIRIGSNAFCLWYERGSTQSQQFLETVVLCGLTPQHYITKQLYYGLCKEAATIS